MTIVAAWINAETGVGPVMASGNHACSGNWPDLPHAPSSRSNVRASATPDPAAPMPPKTAAKLVCPNAQNIVMIARDRPTSPTRFMTKAFLPAVAASGLKYQNEISR